MGIGRAEVHTVWVKYFQYRQKEYWKLEDYISGGKRYSDGAELELRRWEQYGRGRNGFIYIIAGGL